VIRVAFVVNGDERSAASERARSFAARLARAGAFEPSLVHRSGSKLVAVARIERFLARTRPDVVWVVDMSYSGVAGAALHRARGGAPWIVDTGDAITALARSTGSRGPVGIALTSGLERWSLDSAAAIVVRGTEHRAMLARRGIESRVIQDGVDTGLFRPLPSGEVRRRLGLEGSLVVGLLGTSIWSEKLGIAYGWDLVELVALLRGERVKGVLIGDGSGIDRLRARCRELAIEDRVLFLGRLPMEALPEHLAAIDVCLSTQTNDDVGRVRTTGKLPLYLACGRRVLASRVGEAARVLDDDMLVDYEGTVDRGYPARLATRVRALLAAPESLDATARSVAIARERFDYDVLVPRVARVLADAAERARPRATRPAPRRSGLDIAIVVHNHDAADGTGGSTVELVKRLARDHAVTLYCASAPTAPPDEVRVVHVPAARSRAYALILTFPAALRVVMSKHDLVHAQGWVTSHADVVTSHIVLRAWREAARRAGVAEDGLGERLFGSLVDRREAELFQSASLAIAPSEKAARDLRDLYGRRDGVVVVRHGFKAPRSAPPRAEARAELGLPPGAFVALYLGDARKGLGAALRALARADGARLAVVSRSPSGPALEQARALGVAARVDWVGPLADPLPALAAADVLLHPTIYDTFGLAVADAMSAGLPPIVTPAAGAAELIRHGESGWILEGEPAEAAALALSTLSRDPELRERIARGARAVALSRTWDDVARETVAAYERVLSTRGQRSRDATGATSKTRT
jgi:glycosyltransferase involved in cell wall biosynthesis